MQKGNNQQFPPLNTCRTPTSKKRIVFAKIRYLINKLLINFRSNSTINPINSTIEELMCCSGFCIDLLAKFGEELQFEYDLIRVTDPKWGVLKVRKVLFF